MSETIIINEVGPRDGLQNQDKLLTPQQRLGLIQKLVDAQVKYIEAGSFVSPKAVPKMAGSDEVYKNLPATDRVNYTALIPNQRGYDLARSVGAQNVALIMAGTDTMSERNINMNRAEVMAVSKKILSTCVAEKVHSLAYITVAFECPFEGQVDNQVVEDLTVELFASGADEVVIADTIGAANPGQVKTLMKKLVARHGPDKLSCHFHDTRAMGLANVYAALEADVHKFDSCIGGLGGCPFAPGATGNVATEDVVMMLTQMGFDTGIDQQKLFAASVYAAQLMEMHLGGRAQAWLAKQFA